MELQEDQHAMPRRWSSAFRLSGRDLLEQAEASHFPRRSGFLSRWHSLTLRMIQLRSETRSLCALCGLLFKFIAVLLLHALKIIQRTGNLSPHRLGHMRADQRETASHSSPPMVAGNNLRRTHIAMPQAAPGCSGYPSPSGSDTSSASPVRHPAAPAQVSAHPPLFLPRV